MADLDTQIQEARAAIDAHVAEIVQWHFSPETGCPFWLDWARDAGWDPVVEVKCLDDLLAKFPNFQDEWLRDKQPEVWVPKAFSGKPFNIFETGGTTGMPKQRIEAAAARRQALIDQGEEVIVGSNKYQAEYSEPVEVREIDNSAVRKAQIRRLNTIRKNRDTQKVDYALNEITRATETGKGNLLALSIEAMRVRATVGEVSSAMEKIWGRYNAPIQSISGVYAKSFSDQKEISSVREEINLFAKNAGRRPRIMVAKMGQDGHDRGAKVIATAFADLGFDVDIAPLFQTPEEVVKQAIENDVHVIGVSSQAAGHKTLIELLMKVLEKENSEDIVVVAGGVIPPHDYAFLKDLGVACIFGPGTPIPGAAREVLAALSKKF